MLQNPSKESTAPPGPPLLLLPYPTYQLLQSPPPPPPPVPPRDPSATTHSPPGSSIVRPGQTGPDPNKKRPGKRTHFIKKPRSSARKKKRWISSPCLTPGPGWKRQATPACQRTVHMETNLVVGNWWSPLLFFWFFLIFPPL